MRQLEQASTWMLKQSGPRGEASTETEHMQNTCPTLKNMQGISQRRAINTAEVNQKGDILGATELQGPVNYKYKDLKSATENFSDESKLGEGGFGDVYKATLNNGKTVAVKKLAILQIDRAMTSFENEVKLISNVHHRNLIRLLGCCSKGPELLLIFEYMANNSLDKYLFGNPLLLASASYTFMHTMLGYPLCY
ncbi:hypothetical protein ACLB2K_007012 [Fragaria x ananassa]